MDLKELEMYARVSFNNAICLIGIIPFLVFLYLLVVKISSIEILVGEIGFIMLISMLLLLLGVFIARKMLWTVITRLFDFNEKVIKLQKELIEKNRLTAITETTLTLSHEINNPLAVISGTLELLDNEFKKERVPESIKDKIGMIKNHTERMKNITSKLANLSKPVRRIIKDDIAIIDSGKSA